MPPHEDGNRTMHIIIVGAGVTGLTLAYLLSKLGVRVTVLEKERAIGGLAKSFHYEGWSIDIGPHRFHTDDSVVHDFVLEIMRDHIIEIPRNSKVFFCEAHFDWPLNLKSILKLPPRLMFKAFLDLFARPSIKDDSYESYVMNKYGKTLTNHFFREYNQKFLKMDLKDCHRHWAETGINRATIDKDIKSSSIVELLLGVLSQKGVNTRFLYPKEGPIDIFAYTLKEMIEAHGGAVEADVQLRGAYVENTTIKMLKSADGKEWEADYIFWTGDIQDLERLLGLPASPLTFNSTVVCNLLIEGEPPIPSQWEYFGSRDYVICRTSINTCFNTVLAPRGYYGICAELVCQENDFVWNQAESLLNTIIQNLIHAKIINNFNSIVEVRFERVRNTYPIYKIDYMTHLERYTNKIKAFSNILACGRTGGFWYNNMDHCIRSSIDIVNRLVGAHSDVAVALPASGVYRGDF